MSIGLFQSITEARARDRRSLLDQRRRQEDESFGDKLKASITGKISDSLSSAFEGAVEDIIQTPFKRNIEDFENREDLRRKQTQVTTSKRNADTVKKLYQEAESYEGTLDDFWRQYEINKQKELLNTQNESFGKDPTKFKESIGLTAIQRADALVKYGDQSAPLWKRRKDLFYEAYDQYEDIPEGQFSDVVARNNKRASNLVEATAKGIARLFSGKSKEDLDNEALQAIENSPLYKESQEFQTAFELFKIEGRSLEEVQEAAKNMKKDLPPPTYKEGLVTRKENGRNVTYQTQVKIVDGTETQRYWNEQEGQWTDDNTIVNEEGKEITLSPLKIQKGEVDRLAISEKVSTIAGAYRLNKDGLAELRKRAKEQGIDDPFSPTTYEDYQTVIDIVSNLSGEEGFYDKKLSPQERAKETAVLNLQISQLNDAITEHLRIKSQVDAFESNPENKGRQLPPDLERRLRQSENLVNKLKRNLGITDELGTELENITTINDAPPETTDSFSEDRSFAAFNKRNN
tara:strand:+ start:2619 stop:4169 length:1551 start_codon:yes stop_codon:yes gene_type:complete